MHSKKYGDGPEGTTFHHNGDFSGDVIIVRGSSASQSVLHHRTHTASYEVPYEHLEKLVLDKLRNEMIGKLENASYNELRRLLIT